MPGEDLIVSVPRPDLSAGQDPSRPPPATWRAIEAFPVGMIALAATALFAAILARALGIDSSSQLGDNAAVFAFANLFQEIAIIGSVLFWIRYVNHGDVRSLGVPSREPGKDLGTGIVTAVAMVIAAGFVAWALQHL